MTLVRRAHSARRAGPFVVDADALPQTIEVVRTRAEAMGIEVVVADLADGLPDGDLCGVLVQYPGASGRILDPRPVIEAAHERGALAVVAADLLALTLLESPGELGADVVVGSSQRFGVPMFYGGPHAGYMSVARRPRAAPARPPGRRLGRRRGPPGVPPRAADPRAAHPPRQGDLQHLHRPGAAGRGRLDVRRLPRPRGAARDRASASTATPPCWPRCCARAGRGRARPRSSTPCWPACPGARPRSSPAARERGRAPAARRRRPRRHLSVGETHRPRRLGAVLRGVRRRTRDDADAARHRTRCPRRWRATTPYLTHEVFNTPPQRDRRCCATCARCRPATTPSTADDPARLVHDEAQRHHRDGAGLAARASPTCTRSRRPRTPRATAS